MITAKEGEAPPFGRPPFSPIFGAQSGKIPRFLGKFQVGQMGGGTPSFAVMLGRLGVAYREVMVPGASNGGYNVMSKIQRT